MQTRYYTTGSFIRHQDNVVDLSEYRRKLVQAQNPEEESAPGPLPDGEQYSRRPRARRERRSSLLLDACASMGIVVMTLTFTLRVLAM